MSQEMGLVDTTWTPADTLRSLHTYDWRVRGRYGSEEGPWSSAWSFTTGSFVYDAPTQLAPEDSSVNQPVSLELAWQPIEGANGYRVQIGLDSLFGAPHVDSLVTDGGSSPDTVWASVEGLSVDTPYFWRIRVDDTDGTSAWSEVWQFRTIPGEPKRYYYVKDHLGSVRATVNEEGEVVHYDDFYPFGMQMPGRSHIAGTPTKENFTGHELDDETGLLYAGARYLDPVIGRWMSVDPAADALPGSSPYVYVLNNPLTLFDPTGEFPYTIHVRTFAPPGAFSGTGFHHDGTHFSAITATGVTSRIKQSFTIDPSARTYSGGIPISDPTIWNGMSRTATDRGGISMPEFGSNYFGSATASVTLHFEGSNPFFFGLAPDIEVSSAIAITENLKEGKLFVAVDLTSKQFPATEALIGDASGVLIHLGGGAAFGGAGDLVTASGEKISTLDIVINISNNGIFQSASFGGQTYSIEELNEMFTSQSAGPFRREEEE